MLLLHHRSTKPEKRYLAGRLKVSGAILVNVCRHSIASKQDAGRYGLCEEYHKTYKARQTQMIQHQKHNQINYIYHKEKSRQTL